ncbi:amidohydrolase family protein [Butyrivibrio sp. M55]|uniref:amidohydrolase family protein n=1 Tax=Butyrivibrio sp. M55 TaxID=1855323 RepID=UPI0008E7A689|nr:amidohydrolase family protein [Butyrivibrio sp. M55]SFU54183.1 hypothetical protein SAMN05216540_103239 [Butyrivibrio sp. M55]
MIIDVHTHFADESLFSKKFLNGVVGSYPEYNLDMNIINALIKKILSDKFCDKLIKQMDEAGIDKSVLLMADFGYEEKLDWNYFFQKHVDVIKKHPNRLMAFWGCDCRRDNRHVDKFEESIKEYGFKGMKVYPPCGFDLTDNRMNDYYEICCYHGIPVLIHTGASNQDMYNDYDYIQQLKVIQEKFPSLKVVMAHLTTDGFEERVEYCKAHKNCYCDVSAFQREYGKETLAEKIKVIRDTIPDQVLFGTDWPLYSMMGKQKKWVDYFRDSDLLSDSLKEKIFYKNYEYMMEK